MANHQRLLRAYGAADSEMLAYVRLVQANFLEDLVDFTAFDPALEATYATDFLAAIEAAENFSNDVQLRGILKQSTAAVEAAMELCRQDFQILKYFVRRAFGGNVGREEEFGFERYEAVRANQNDLIQFMLTVFETATKYTAELTAVGYDAVKVSALETDADALQAANTAQEQTKGERSSASHDRVLLLNAAWGKALVIREAAKLVYDSNWSYWERYKVPWVGKKPSLANEIKGSVPFGATVNVSVPDLTEETVLNLENTGDFPLRFCGSNILGMDCGASGLVLNVGDSVSIKLRDLAPVDSHPTALNVSHTVLTDPVPDGTFSVIWVVE